MPEKKKVIIIHDIIISLLYLSSVILLSIMIRNFEFGLTVRENIYPNISQIIIDNKFIWMLIFFVFSGLFIGDIFWVRFRESQNVLVLIPMIITVMLCILLFFYFAGAVFYLESTLLMLTQ